MIALVAIVFTTDFVRLTLFVYGIEPPFIDGMFYILYYILFSIAIGILIVDYFRGGSFFYATLIVLLILITTAPLIAGTLIRPEHSGLIVMGLNQAFASAAFAAMGLLYAKFGLRFREVLVLWLVMLIATIPAVIQMISDGFGAETRLAAAGMHITLGDQILMMTLLLIIASRTLGRRLLVFSIGFVLLSAVGSRTSLYAYAFALPVILLASKEKQQLLSFRFVSITALTISLPFIMNYITGESASGTRMFGFFSEGTTDSSWQGRIDQMRAGLEDIAANPITGSFGSDVDRYGSIGFYIHNYLELWRQFGILPFALFTGLVIYTVLVIILRHRLIPKDVRFAVILLLVPFLIQIIFSRSYGYPHIFFILGMMALLTTARLSIDQRPRADVGARDTQRGVARQ
ncbi:MAG: hypothetical protein K2Y04_00475 [Caulobacteraceae bacterium]|nr:hypothetical protein [Caulobacteraceae bacterium]